MNNSTNISVSESFHRPLYQLVSEAHRVHLDNFPEGSVQASSLLSIKTGGCPENCSYCPQSAHYKTGVNRTLLMEKSAVMQAAEKAKSWGASRFCMGAAWREVKEGADFDRVLDLVKSIRSIGLEVCCTLGMLNLDQAKKLKEAGLHFYNHNLDTSPDHYRNIVQTRNYEDRLKTLQNVRDAGLSVCTGGIIGLGESESDRIAFIEQIVSMSPQPESITVNTLVPIPGTPLENAPAVDPFDLIRVIATFRVLAPRSMIRLSAGRSSMSQETQFLCFLAGANSIFIGNQLLTSPNPETSEDDQLLMKSGLTLQGSTTL
jgi:biotin synthase